MRRSFKIRMLSGLMPRTWMISRGSRAHARLALTFDDGPHPIYTPRLLDLLAAHGARATFFLIGENIESFPSLVWRMVEEGHELGNHSYSHLKFGDLPLSQQLKEIERTEALLARHDGAGHHFFRPPQGRLSWRLFAALRWRHKPVAMWSYDSLDYRGKGTDLILRTFAEEPIGNGEVVLFHDDNEHTLVALAELLPVWRVHGYAFATVGQIRRG